MRILVIGDPHFKKDNLHIMKYVTQEILTIIDEYKPDMTISLGDTLDKHDSMYLRANSDAEYFYLAIGEKCKLVVLIGNHDRENNSDYMTGIHPFVALGRNNGIKVVGRTESDRQGKYKFIYVPYVHAGRFQEALEGQEVTDSDIIFCHQEFAGCLMNGKRSTDGDRWNLKGEKPTIISGHIHEYQTMGKIIYPGTFMQHNYGETEDKALMLLELDHDVIKYNRIRLTSPPLRRSICLESSQLRNYRSMLPANNVKKWQPDNSGIQQVLTRAIIRLDSTEVKSIRNNEYYLELEQLVNKVELDVTTIKTNQAVELMTDNKEVTIETLVNSMLQDDTEALSIFQKLLKEK